MTISDNQYSPSSSGSQDPLVGTLVANRYSILSRVAKGGTAVIYQALDTVLKREVAVKILHEHLENRQEVVQRLKREAQLIAQLRHPNILTVYDFVQHQGRAVLVVEYMPGTTLSGIIQSTEKIPEDYVLMMILDILQGLKAAHEAGITHRDIKPANVLVHADLGVKISDFGLAKILDSEDGLTKEGIFVGTPSFSSPEQIEGRPVDHRSDIFSLGLTMYMLATRTHAFKNKGDSTTTVWYKTVKGVFDPIRERNPLISPEFEKIVLKALQVDLDKRYASAPKMIEDVEGLLKKRNAIPYKESLKKFLKEPTKTKGINRTGGIRLVNRWSIAAAIVVIFALGGFVFWSQSSKNLSETKVQMAETIPAIKEPLNETPIAEESKQEESRQEESQPVEFIPPVIETVKKKPKKSQAAEIKGAPNLLPHSIIVLKNENTKWSAKIEWKKGNSFKLFDSRAVNKILVGGESERQSWDISSLKPGKYFWEAGSDKGDFEVLIFEEYQKRFIPAKRPLVILSQFADVDIELNPWTQNLRFSWASGPNAANYRVDIASDEGFSNLIFSGTSSEKHLNVERSWTKDQTFYWRVSFLDDQKNVFFVDRVRKINLKLKGVSAALDILSPSSTATLTDNVSVQISGPAQAKIECREMSPTKADRDFVSLSSNGSLFSKNFSLGRVAENLICRAQNANQAFLFWLF